MHQIITFVTTHWVWFVFSLFYLINLILGKRSQIDNWALQNPKIGGVFKLIRGILPCEPFLILQGLSLILKGTLPARLAPIVNVIDTTTEPLPPGVPPTPSA